MGQDRHFNDEQIEFVLDNVQHFSDSWTKTECENLRGDIKKRHEATKKDREYMEGELAHNLQVEEDKYVDEYYDSLEEHVDEEAKAERTHEVKVKFIQHKFWDGDWKHEIMKFREYRVVRFPRFWQSLFYFLGYSREDIWEEGTNKLFWKKASKKLTDGLFEKMKAYTHKGPKDKEYKKYQLLNFIEKNIKDLTSEEIEQYSFVQAKLFKWMSSLIEMRKDDIHKRREIKEKREGRKRSSYWRS